MSGPSAAERPSAAGGDGSGGPERGPEQGSEQTPERGPERGPEQGSEQTPERGSEQAQERGSERRPEQAPERASELAPERRPEQAPERSAEQGPERGPEQGSKQAQERGSERRPEQAPERRPEQAPERASELAPERSAEQAPERSAEQAPERSAEQVPGRRVAAQVALAIAAISTGAPFARWAAPAPPIAIAALRVSIAAALLLAMGWRELGSLRRIPPRERPLVALAGVLLAVHFGSWIASLSFTSTAASVALVCTSPIFAALLSALVGDRVARRERAGIAIAAVGCAVLAGGDWRAGGDALIGDGLALIGAASAAAYLVVGRRLRAAVPLVPYLGTVNAVAAAALVLAAVAAGHDLAALPGRSYLACAGAAVMASGVGHSLLNAAVRTTPAHLVALAVLGEPIGSSLIAWAAFGEQPPLHAALGGAVVLVGIAVGFAARRAGRPSSTPARRPAAARRG